MGRRPKQREGDGDQCEVIENGRRCKGRSFLTFYNHQVCMKHWYQDGKDGFELKKELKI